MFQGTFLQTANIADSPHMVQQKKTGKIVKDRRGRSTGWADPRKPFTNNGLENDDRQSRP